MHFDRSLLKLTIDGVEQLKIQGAYSAPDTKYTTELEQNGAAISITRPSFLLTDASGARAGYRTTEDTRILDASGQVKEWHSTRPDIIVRNSTMLSVSGLHFRPAFEAL
ncbi:unnamed protein product [Clonostachys rosea]|uniref:Uncharacterized protein n=1 Tax=Bionectria ochroleuca TaxID=29856 RepID=A0ABY6V4B7_BIOOC|nr:unnamed protein product [Clonostachys rosea]